MSEMKQYVILGLGIFGSTIAKTLSQYNHEVIAIDKDLACVDRVSDFVTQAIQADFTDIDQLRAIGIQDCDAAVVATGSHLEESIMGVMNLRELGIPFIMAKAKNKKYMQILQKIGADYVVRPEKEMGERVAKKLVSRNIIDLIDIDDDYSIVEIAAPAKWVGKTLKALDCGPITALMFWESVRIQRNIFRFLRTRSTRSRPTTSCWSSRIIKSSRNLNHCSESEPKPENSGFSVFLDL